MRGGGRERVGSLGCVEWVEGVLRYFSDDGSVILIRESGFFEGVVVVAYASFHYPLVLGFVLHISPFFSPFFLFSISMPGYLSNLYPSISPPPPSLHPPVSCFLVCMLSLASISSRYGGPQHSHLHPTSPQFFFSRLGRCHFFAFVFPFVLMSRVFGSRFLWIGLNCCLVISRGYFMAKKQVHMAFEVVLKGVRPIYHMKLQSAEPDR